jgi:hypothetical protein
MDITLEDKTITLALASPIEPLRLKSELASFIASQRVIGTIANDPIELVKICADGGYMYYNPLGAPDTEIPDRVEDLMRWNHLLAE